ncbi:GNAT family N-acetyltransferase [Thalassospira sp. TSL5-1]|uniref:GNAT family N-acetyltransferase n=1 Tax=Thalassospira sp. TSL5-1 TaxID=1544451 RepID=UPI00093B17EC|nr:GNAT family N-acetyltransferase [Thalassospira sp. TSL5-1]OKH87728.1 acetyltransferase [Thalassospira sp. TSL5-1]
MSLSALTIRPYEPQDCEQLLEIWLAASRLGHAFLGKSTLLDQRAIVRDVYLPQAENYVALSGQTPVGFIGLLDCFIGGLFVDPAFHGKNIGRALVEHVSPFKPWLELEVYAANPLAPPFYRKLGFHEISRRANDDEGRPFELIRMQREQQQQV